MAQKNPYPFRALGRRKTSVARLYMGPGQGLFEVNERPLESYFCRKVDRLKIMKPFQIAKVESKRYKINVNVTGGGTTGQAEALQLAISRVLISMDAKARPALKREGLLTRDSREVERKKPGRAGARKRFQYSKR